MLDHRGCRWNSADRGVLALIVVESSCGAWWKEWGAPEMADLPYWVVTRIPRC
jgi:hypothetical protein